MPCFRTSGCSNSVDSAPSEVLVVHDMPEDDDGGAGHCVRADGATARAGPSSTRTGRGPANAIRCSVSAMPPRRRDRGHETGRSPISSDRSGMPSVAASRYMKGGRQEGGPMAQGGDVARSQARALYHVGSSSVRRDATNSPSRRTRQDFVREVERRERRRVRDRYRSSSKAHRRGLPGHGDADTRGRHRHATGNRNFKVAAWTPLYLRWYLLRVRTRPITNDRCPI